MRVMMSLIGLVALMAGGAPALAVECPASCSTEGCLADPTGTVVVGGDYWAGCTAVSDVNYCYDGLDSWECNDSECEAMIRSHC